MLGRNKYVINPYWLDSSILYFLILHDNLALTVRSKPRNGSIFPLNGHFFTNLIAQNMGVGVKSFSIPFICSITKHKALITCTYIMVFFVYMDCSCNVTVLGRYISYHITFKTVKASFITSKSDLFANFSRNLLKTYLIVCETCLAK